MTSLISCRDVCKRFYHFEHRTVTLQEVFLRRVLRRPARASTARFELLHFSVEIQAGDAVALIGSNGSGKSTALRLMAGIYQPTSGQLERRGSVAALIESGATFDAELTGEENVRLSAAALGLTRRAIERSHPAILEIAELGDFAHVPTKYYSSGMRARLAFAIAMAAEPDVLILDEVLSVGDEHFTRRSLERLAAFRARGGALVLVSHDMRLLRSVCPDAIWLDGGRERMHGPSDHVLNAYLSAQNDPSHLAGKVPLS
jgi:ABC-type polysaccharide/polyol phosphate transport system ATPase subunit